VHVNDAETGCSAGLRGTRIARHAFDAPAGVTTGPHAGGTQMRILGEMPISCSSGPRAVAKGLRPIRQCATPDPDTVRSTSLRPALCERSSRRLRLAPLSRRSAAENDAATRLAGAAAHDAAGRAHRFNRATWNVYVQTIAGGCSSTETATATPCRRATRTGRGGDGPVLLPPDYRVQPAYSPMGR